jgi:aspartate/methionine/tyrosine aminotransferase
MDDFATERGIQFVCDEVFHPIYHGRVTDSASVLPHATVVGDFSKALSLPGLRLGWIVERDSRRRKEYLNARAYCTVSNSSMSEFLGEIALTHREDVLKRTRDVACRNLQLLERVFLECPHILDWVRPQGGMTGFARLVSGLDARPFCQAALNYGLLLAPGDCWGVADHFRIGSTDQGARDLVSLVTGRGYSAWALCQGFCRRGRGVADRSMSALRIDAAILDCSRAPAS